MLFVQCQRYFQWQTAFAFTCVDLYALHMFDVGSSINIVHYIGRVFFNRHAN